MSLTPAQIARPGTEHAIQAAFFASLQPYYGQYPCLATMHAIPNGGDRSPIVAGRLKAEGVRAGVPDVELPVARRGYHSLWLEFKKPEHRCHANGGMSDAQVAMAAMLREEGNCVLVVYEWDAALRITLAYLAG